MDKLLTRTELAETLQVCERTLLYWEKKGRLRRAVWSPPRYDLQDVLTREKHRADLNHKKKRNTSLTTLYKMR